MPAWFTAIITGVSAFFGWRKAEAEADLREMDQDHGALKQQNADMKATIDAKDDQLRKAVNRKSGDSRKRLRDGCF